MVEKGRFSKLSGMRGKPSNEITMIAQTNSFSNWVRLKRRKLICVIKSVTFQYA